MGRLDPPFVARRLAVPLVNLRVGMVAQIPTRGHRWMRLEMMTGLLRGPHGAFRDGDGAFQWGSGFAGPEPIRLNEADSPFQVKPHLGMLEAGDVVTIGGLTIEVTEVIGRAKDGSNQVEVWGQHMRGLHARLLGHRGEFTAPVTIVVWAGASESERARSLRAGRWRSNED